MPAKKKQTNSEAIGEPLTGLQLHAAIGDGKEVYHVTHGVKKATVIGKMPWLEVALALKNGQIKAYDKKLDTQT